VKYLLGRLAYLLVVVFLVSVAVSGLLFLMPGDPASVILGLSATPNDVRILNHELGLDGSFIEQYWRWLTNALHGDLGISFQTKESTSHAIAQGLPVSLELVVLAFAISLGISVPTAIYCARRVGGLVDKIAMFLSSALLSLPVYIAGIGMLYFLTVKFQIFPSGSWVSLMDDPVGNIRRAILPAVSISLLPLASFFRVLRTDMIATLQQDFVLSARAKGLSSGYVLMRHALRPSLFTLMTTAGVFLGHLIGGSFIVEQIFQIPGMGLFMIQAITAKDVRIIQGITLVTALAYVVVNLVVDMLYSVVDPRVRRR